MRWLLVQVYVILALSGYAFGQNNGEEAISDPPGIDTLVSLQEKFTYEVRYGFLNLGTVTITILQDTTYEGSTVHYIFSVIKSNPGIPLVGYKERHYHSFVKHDGGVPYGVRFWTDSLHDELYEETLYLYDYDEGYVYTFEEGEPVDTLELTGPADSGPALFYFSRLFAGTDETVEYPIYISHERGNVELRNSSRMFPFSSPAFPDEDVMAFRTRGNADVDGPFGFRGRIDAVFKADELRIPLEARVRVWLGNVRVRLVEYEVE